MSKWRESSHLSVCTWLQNKDIEILGKFLAKTQFRSKRSEKNLEHFLVTAIQRHRSKVLRNIYDEQIKAQQVSCHKAICLFQSTLKCFELFFHCYRKLNIEHEDFVQ